MKVPVLNQRVCRSAKQPFILSSLVIIGDRKRLYMAWKMTKQIKIVASTCNVQQFMFPKRKTENSTGSCIYCTEWQSISEVGPTMKVN